MAELNLASRPARNETLPTLAVYLALATLLAVTAKHAFVVRDLMPGRTSARRAEVVALEEEQGRIRRESASLRGPLPDKAVLARWAAIKLLVDKRTFSWTRLLARLETVIPEGVRILAIAPHVENGVVTLDLTVAVRSSEAGLEILRRLQQRAAFRDAMPISDSASKDDVSEYRYSMRYDPSAPDEARPAAATQESPADESDAPAEGEEPQ